jgi:TatD DNase family protein
VGVHPWYAGDWTKDTIRDHLFKFTGQPGLCAIGECGLDRLRGPEIAQQEMAFIAQIEFSEEMGLPLILHCVRATERLLHLHKKTAPRQQWIFHGFNLRLAMAEALLKEGLKLSFGSAILNRRSAAAKALAACPADQFLLETDEAACSIEEVYAAAAEIRQMAPDGLKVLVFQNWKRTFAHTSE